MDAQQKAPPAADQGRTRRRRSLVALGSSIAFHAAILTGIALLAPSWRLASRPSYYVLAYLDSAGGASAGLEPSASKAGNSASASAAGSATNATPVRRKRPQLLARLDKSDYHRTDRGEESASAKPAAALAPTRSVVAGEGQGSWADRSAHTTQTGTGGNAQIASLGAGGQGESAGMGDGEAHAEYGADPAPLYPASARRENEQGEVTLRVLVGADGSVERVEISQSSGFERLDDSALETVSHKWRFEPARRMGVKVESWIVVPIRFRLSEARAN